VCVSSTPLLAIPRLHAPTTEAELAFDLNRMLGDHRRALSAVEAPPVSAEHPDDPDEGMKHAAG
jgi:hypothetical protein